MKDPSLFDLFGTDEPQPTRRDLRAGSITAMLEDGNLRYIRFAGVEVLRAVNFLARDTGWGTYAPVISDLDIVQDAVSFRVTYAARCEGPEGRFDYAMTITGHADGTVGLMAVGRAMTAFPTNRTGFVVLHSADVAGQELTIQGENGVIHSMTFPSAIDPGVPATGIRAMEHTPAPGLLARVEMTGDLFEMEDQRNWADASFKTYVRPLSKPRPYVIAAGTSATQSVTLRISGGRATPTVLTGSDPHPAIGPAIGVMPDIALFVDRAEAVAGDPALVGSGLAQQVIWRWRLGDSLTEAQKFSADIGAECVVEAIFPARNPADEAAALMDALAGASCQTVLVAPAREFKTSAPATIPTGEVPVDDLVVALRAAGFTGRIVAGTPSFFPEFNRNPPGSAADGVYFGGCGIVHAADDLSVMETLTVYPAILSSAAICGGGRPIWLGPCTIGARHAPYGPAVFSNPDKRRIPMTGDDPRHGALFGAAYVVGLAAACAGTSVTCLTIAAPFGPFGIAGPQSQRPLFAIQQTLAAAAGSVRRSVLMPGLVAVGWESGNLEVLAANTGDAPVTTVLPDGAFARILGVDANWSKPVTGKFTLGPYRTARITYSSSRDL